LPAIREKANWWAYPAQNLERWTEVSWVGWPGIASGLRLYGYGPANVGVVNGARLLADINGSSRQQPLVDGLVVEIGDSSRSPLLDCTQLLG